MRDHRLMPRRKYGRMIPHEQAVTVGANIRALRRAYGWTQAQLAGKMGWASPSTVCAAEGHRDRTQRNFTPAEIDQLAGIFDVRPWELTSRCAHCEGNPPAGYTCQTCGRAAWVTTEGSAAYVKDNRRSGS